MDAQWHNTFSLAKRRVATLGNNHNNNNNNNNNNNINNNNIEKLQVTELRCKDNQNEHDMIADLHIQMLKKVVRPVLSTKTSTKSPESVITLHIS